MLTHAAGGEVGGCVVGGIIGDIVGIVSPTILFPPVPDGSVFVCGV